MRLALDPAGLLGPDWGVPPEDAPASRVTVTFTPTAGGTRVDLVHDDLDRHGRGWEALRDSVDSDGGWPGLLRAFAAAAVGGSGQSRPASMIRRRN